MQKDTVTVRGVPHTTLKALKAKAESSHRSLNGELLAILEDAARDAGGAGGSRVRETAASPYSGRAAPLVTRSADLDLEVLGAVCRRYHIRRLAVFGSLARGDARPDSDVDVAVDFEPGMTPGLGIIRVAEDLRPVFGNRRVDLVTRRGLSARLRERLRATEQVLYGS